MRKDSEFLVGRRWRACPEVKRGFGSVEYKKPRFHGVFSYVCSLGFFFPSFHFRLSKQPLFLMVFSKSPVSEMS